MAEYWMRCTECKTELAFGAKYYQCSVSTCNRSKFRLVFCTIVCWDSHLADARHRDAWAEEARAPTRDVWQREVAARDQEAPPRSAPAPVPSAAPPRPAPPASSPSSSAGPPRPAPPVSSPSSSAGPPRPAPPAPSPSPSPSPAPSPGGVPVRRVVGDTSQASAAAVEGLKLSEVVDRDVLIVISKLKKYIKDRSGMNCSDAVADMLSDHVRLLCDEAIRSAARDERKTVLDRDVVRVRR